MLALSSLPSQLSLSSAVNAGMSLYPQLPFLILDVFTLLVHPEEELAGDAEEAVRLTADLHIKVGGKLGVLVTGAGAVTRLVQKKNKSA